MKVPGIARTRCHGGRAAARPRRRTTGAAAQPPPVAGRLRGERTAAQQPDQRQDQRGGRIGVRRDAGRRRDAHRDQQGAAAGPLGTGRAGRHRRGDPALLGQVGGVELVGVVGQHPRAGRPGLDAGRPQRGTGARPAWAAMASGIVNRSSGSSGGTSRWTGWASASGLEQLAARGRAAGPAGRLGVERRRPRTPAQRVGQAGEVVLTATDPVHDRHRGPAAEGRASGAGEGDRRGPRVHVGGRRRVVAVQDLGRAGSRACRAASRCG